MTTYELFEIICEHYNYDKKEIITNLNELLFSIHENPKKFEFYYRFEKLAIKALEEEKGKKVCANVDFYSGLIYEMLNIPRDLFIPIFAAARLVGWISHDIENLLYCNKIIRPATKYVGLKED